MTTIKQTIKNKIAEFSTEFEFTFHDFTKLKHKGAPIKAGYISQMLSVLCNEEYFIVKVGWRCIGSSLNPSCVYHKQTPRQKAVPVVHSAGMVFEQGRRPHAPCLLAQVWDGKQKTKKRGK